MEKARSRKPPRPDGGLSSMDKLDSFLKDREHLAEEEQKRRPADERSRGAYSTVSILRKKATAAHRTDGSGRSSRSRSQPRAGGRSYDDESSRDMDDDIDDDIYDDHPRDGSSRSSRSRKSKHSKQQPLDRLDKFLAEKEDYAPRVSSDDRSRGAYSTVSRSRKTTSSAARSKSRPRLNSKDNNNINGTAKPSLDHIREVDSVAEMSYNHSERSGVVPPPASAEPKNGGGGAALGSYFSSEEEQYPKDGNKKRRGGKGDSRSVYTSMPSRRRGDNNEDADGVPIPKTEDELLAVLRTPARRNARRSNKDSASVAPSSSSSKTKDLRGSRSVAPKEEGTGRRASMSKSTREGGRVKSTHTSRSRRTSADRDDEDYHHDDDNYSKAPPRSSRRQSNGVPRDDDDRSIVTRSRRRASNNADHHDDDHYSRAPRRSRGGDDDEDYYSRAAPRKGRGGGRGHDHDNDDDYSRAPRKGGGGRHSNDSNNDYDDDNYSRAPRRRRDDHHDNDDDNASIVRRSRRRDEDDNYSRAAPRRRRKDEDNDDDNASIVRRRRRDSAHGAADHRTRRNSNATESRRRNRSPSRGRRLSGDAPTTTRPRSRSRAPRRNSTEGRGGGGGRGPPPRRPSNDDVVRGSRGRRYSNDAAADNRSRRPRSKSRGRRSAEEDLVETRPPRARSKSRGRRYSNDHPTTRNSRPRSKSRARRPSNEDTTTSRRSRRPSNDDAPSRSRVRAPEDDEEDDEQQVYDDDQDEVFEHGVRRKHYDPRDGSDSEYEKRTRRGGGHDSDSEGRHDSDEDTVRTKDTATQQPRRRSHDKPGTSARRPKTDADRQKNRKTLRSALRGEMEDLPRDEENKKDDDGDLLDDMMEPVNGNEDAAVEQQQSDNIRPSPAVAAMSGADRPAKSPFQTMSLPGQTTNNGAVKKPLVSVLRQPAPPPETKEEEEEHQDETESTPIQDGHGGPEEDGMEDETPKRDNRLRTGRPHPPHAPNMLLDGGEEKASSSELNVDYSEQDIFTSYTWSLARQDPQKIQRERQILRGFIRGSPLYQAFELLELRPTENGS